MSAIESKKAVAFTEREIEILTSLRKIMHYKPVEWDDAPIIPAFMLSDEVLSLISKLPVHDGFGSDGITEISGIDAEEFLHFAIVVGGGDFIEAGHLNAFLVYCGGYDYPRSALCLGILDGFEYSLAGMKRRTQ